MNENQIISHLEDLKTEAEGHFTDDGDSAEVPQQDGQRQAGGQWRMMMFVAGFLIGCSMAAVLIGVAACVIASGDAERKNKKK